MNTRNILSVLAALAIVAAAVSLTSCPASIYYTLENEVETPDNTLNNEISFFDVAKIAAGAPYYAAGGNIWFGTSPSPAITWGTTSLTPPQTGMLCNGLVAFGAVSNLYGAFFAPSGTARYGLFKAGGAGPSFAPSDTTEVGTVTDVKGKQISLLRVIPAGADELAAATAVPSESGFIYSLYDSSDGSTFNLALTGLTDPITGVTFANSAYWAVSGSILYSGPVGTMVPTAIGSYTIGAGDGLRDVFADGNTLIISSKLGAVYYCPDIAAPAWQQVAAAKVGDKTVGFLGIAGPVSTVGDKKYLVGSDGYGYYTLTAAATPTLERFSVSTIGLYAAGVRKFFVDGSTVFAETLGKGLWRAVFTADGVPDSSGWKQE